MRHPQLSKDDDPPAVTTDEAFDTLWKAKGWRLTDDQGAFLTGKAATTPATPTEGGGS